VAGSASGVAGSVHPAAFAQALIRCRSVTPADDGALAVVAGALETLGFVCHRLRFQTGDAPPIENLYARFGTRPPVFCFAGHTDVVPAGAGWSVDPFAGEIVDGRLFGRGAVDMKGALAAMVAAAGRLVGAARAHGDGAGGQAPPGSLAFVVTGDEEGDAVDGTRRVLTWLEERGERIDACLIGEPTNPRTLGEAIKIGRRGSLNARLVVTGAQGHVAYPHLADNPLPRLARMLVALDEMALDRGTPVFPPSTLAVTTIDTGNPAVNVIPARAEARFNIRFNDLHSGASLERLLRDTLDRVGGAYELSVMVSGEAFLTPTGPLSDAVTAAVERVTGRRPRPETTGGISDARFFRTHCPVVEFGLVGATMHRTDEHVALADLEGLTDIYSAILEEVFSLPPNHLLRASALPDAPHPHPHMYPNSHPAAV